MIEITPNSAHHTRNLQDYLRILRRRKLAVWIPVAAAMGIAAFLYTQAQPRYVAEVVIALDVRRVQVLPADAVVSPLPQDSPVLQTELDVISSRTMADRVADILEHKGYQPADIAPPLAETFRQRIERWIGDGWQAVVGPPSPDQSEPQSEAEETPIRRDVIDRLLGDLQVSNDGRSYTIFISYTAEDPEFAATAANAFGEAYLSYQASVQSEATRQASEWLGAKLDDLRQRLEASEAAAERFRRDAGLIESDGMTLATQRINALNIELVQARSSRADAEARLETARTLSRSEEGLDNFAQVLNSGTIQALRAEQARVERSLSELQDTGAVKSSQLPSFQSQLVSLKQQIATEVERILKSLENELDVAQRKEAAILAAFQEAGDDLTKTSDARVQLNQLEREATADRTIYETYLNRYKQTIEQEGYAIREARMVSEAEPPSVPASPKLVPYAALGLLAGLGLGFGLALLRESTDDRVRSPSDLESAIGLPVIDLVPRIRGAKRPTAVSAFVLDQPRSAFSEAIRALRSTLQLAPATRRAQVLMFTSVHAGEGKTSLAVSLARSVARTGLKVIVVDADLRKPAIAEQFGTATALPLPDVIGGVQSFEEAIQVDPRSQAHFIAPAPSGDSFDFILGGVHLREALANLRKRYDLIILDTAPASTSTDAAQMGGLADAVILVVRWGRTTTQAIATTVRQLAFRGVTVSGVILNGVPSGRQGRYEAGPPAAEWPPEIDHSRPPDLRGQAIGLVKEA
ncbi:polysaccharide biosynthesis tyrosine autokinase [Inquilinus limosus]|uniref:GumC family protein n=1 Tax=Inquilinus limosus TaxID=171674 RepID=UPI003F17439E